MQAIVVCTVNSPSIHVLLESVDQYASGLPIYVSSNSLEWWEKIRERLRSDRVIFRPNTATNFGDAYNAIISYAFNTGRYDSLIIANDDIVLTPSTISKMKEDEQMLRDGAHKVGFLGARSDYVLPDQNIRFPVYDDKRVGPCWASESQIKQTNVIAPIFAAINQESWKVAQFPSTNWYSDNIICHDLSEAGFKHFVSRGYVHHAGSQTIGDDFKKCHEEPREWIKLHRPDMYEIFYG